MGAGAVWVNGQYARSGPAERSFAPGTSLPRTIGPFSTHPGAQKLDSLSVVDLSLNT